MSALLSSAGLLTWEGRGSGSSVSSEASSWQMLQGEEEVWTL